MPLNCETTCLLKICWCRPPIWHHENYWNRFTRFYCCAWPTLSSFAWKHLYCFVRVSWRMLLISTQYGRWAWLISLCTPLHSYFILWNGVRGARQQLTVTFWYIFSSTADCIGLASSYEVTMLQDEALNLLLETCGGTRMGHILLTLPYIRSAADRQLIQVNSFIIYSSSLFMCRNIDFTRASSKGVVNRNSSLFSTVLPSNRNFYSRKPLVKWPSRMCSAN